MLDDRLPLLNEREKDCLRLVHRGLQSSEIARELNRPLDTVERQIKSARAKFGNQRRTVVARLLADSEHIDQSLVGHSLVLAGGGPGAANQISGQAVDAGEEVHEERAIFHGSPAVVPDRTEELERRLDQVGAQLRVLIIATVAIGTAVIALLMIPFSERAHRVAQFVSHQQ